MSTDTRPRVFNGIIDIFKALGSTDIIEEYDSEVVILDPMLVETLKNIEEGKLKKEVENPTNVTGGSKKSKGGFAKVNPNPIKNSGTEKAMRAKYEKVQEELSHEERE